MIHGLIAETGLRAQAGDKIVIEKVDSRWVQRVHRLEVVESGLGSSVNKTAKSSIRPEDEPELDWICLLIREILGKL